MQVAFFKKGVYIYVGQMHNLRVKGLGVAILEEVGVKAIAQKGG